MYARNCKDKDKRVRKRALLCMLEALAVRRARPSVCLFHRLMSLRFDQAINSDAKRREEGGAEGLMCTWLKADVEMEWRSRSPFATLMSTFSIWAAVGMPSSIK